ncbi:thioredoxin family protein [Candidatus Peregrinibacteria bacterium]|nr:thioredoxin family protein [Candidatus Peregrinibacteria bacterium]
MKIIHKILIVLLLFIGSFQVVYAEGPTLNFYYGNGCPHCAQVEPFIEQMAMKYPNLDIMQYEVYNNKVNSSRLMQAFEAYGVPVNQRGVPIVFLNGTYFLGDRPILDNLENEINKVLVKTEEKEVESSFIPDEEKIIVSYQTKGESTDPVIQEPKVNLIQQNSDVGEIENVDMGAQEPIDKVIQENIDEDQIFVSYWKGWHWWTIILIGFIIFYGIYKFWTAKKICFCLTDRQKDYVTVGIAAVVLVGFFFLAKNISPEFLETIGYSLPLPIFTFFIALVDGFNPCNLFVLTFLLALLVSASHSKARIYAVGFSFVFMVFVIYFLFMAAWLNIFKYIGFITPLRVAIAMIALIAGIINCKELLFFRKGITLMVQESHKGLLVRRIEHMKEIIEKGTFPVLISSSIALATFASLVELPCTAGFPIIYTGILSAKSLSTFSYYGYLALYNLFYILPLAVVITIFGYTFQGKKISQRQMQIIKFIGGLIMILLGIILLVNPSMIGIAG